MGTAGTAALISVMRANQLDERNKSYVVTARGKGLLEWKLILKYPLWLALNPLVSTLGYLLSVLMSAASLCRWFRACRQRGHSCFEPC